jgi:DNA/RNA-binding domain of Phe-tRNA-synthetase-like protein
MKIEIANRISQRGFYLRLVIVEFRAIIKDSDLSFLKHIQKSCKEIQQSISMEDITKIPAINAARKAYKQCGKDPSRYRPSADSLIRRIVKGNDLYRVNNVVDYLNLVSIQTGISIGGYDTSKIVGNPIMDIGSATEVYYGIGRGILNIEGLPVLRDDKGAFGSPTSDSERTMISKETNHAAFVFYDFGEPKQLDIYLDSLLQDLVRLFSATDIHLSYVRYSA